MGGTNRTKNKLDYISRIGQKEKAMRKLNIPKSGFVFRHKKNTELFARELYLAEGESLDDWGEITEAEYEAEQEKIFALGTAIEDEFFD